MNEGTYALRNTHWNERGNAVAAQALAEALAPFVRERLHADPGLTRGPENR